MKRYQYGLPIQTDSVIDNYPIEKDQLPFFTTVVDEKITLTYLMDEKDIVYGLGENTRGMNKRGWIYTSKCADDPIHTEEKSSLYGAHNFLMIKGKETFGLFIDYPGIITYDIGYTKLDILEITITDGNVDLYFIEGDSLLSIVRELRGLVGKSYIPPKWGMGFGQCRWSYMNADEVREVAQKYRENNIPIDSIYLDIDYMEKYKDFTIDKSAFPDFPDFVNEMKNQGIRLVPIIDAGVKIEQGYDIYEEGVAKNFFCKDENGKDFVAGVWPGRVHFPDFLNSDARRWFGSKYKYLLDLGIEGFWNDMNEPAMFYSEDGLNEAFKKIQDFGKQNLDIQSFFEFTGMVGSLANNLKDYERFYHNKDGEKIRHDKVHNLYGYHMTRAAAEAFEEIVPEKRILMFSRASHIGMHRYGGIWTGDNHAWWSHILLSMKQMPSLNMIGILFAGSDIGGFGGNTTEDLVMRFTQWGMFTPLMRNHAAMGTRRQEAYAFSEVDSFRKMIQLRYFFLPYLYSEYMRAALKDEMYFMPLSFIYPEDEMACQVEDQLFIGNGLMVTPIYTQNAKGRYVYLPEKMKMYRFRSMEDFDIQYFEKGHYYIEIELNEVVIFVRENHIIPCSLGGKNVEEISDNTFKILNYVTDSANYTLYQDDGLHKNYEEPSHFTTICVNHDQVKVEGRKKIICYLV